MKLGTFEGIMEHAQCPLCREDALSRLVFQSKEGIGFHMCLRCGLMYVSPRFIEASMMAIYENEAFADLSMYDRWSYDEWKRSGKRSYNIEEKKVSLIKRYLPDGSRILDVGCGTGLFVLKANKEGFLCEG